MYARISNNKLEYYTKKFIKHNGVNYSNPPEEIMNMEGWYLVPEIPLGVMATSWELVDGELVPNLKDIPDTDIPGYRKFSVMKLVVQLKARNLYGKLVDWLTEHDLLDEWQTANDIRDNHPLFLAAIGSICEALEIDDATCQEILNNSIMDED